MTITSIEALTPDIPIAVYPRGPIGPSAELRLWPVENPTHIQKRQEGGSWSNFIALSALVGPVGPVGLVWAGAWEDDTAYVLRNAVLHASSAWYALQASTNVEPGSDDAYWSLLVDGSGAAEDREAAEDAAALAEKWAEEDEDVTVEPGAYSAKHHAIKAAANTVLSDAAVDDAEDAAALSQAWAAGTLPGGPGTKSAKEYSEIAEAAAGAGASTITVAPTGNIASTNVQAALAELDTEKAPVSHTHSIANVTGLSTALADKADDSDITALDGRLDVLEGQTLDARLDVIETGYVLIHSQAATGTSADFISLNFDEVQIKLAGVSHNSGSSQSIGISYSINNGSSWTSWGLLSATDTAAALVDRLVVITGLFSGDLNLNGRNASPPSIGTTNASNGIAFAGAKVNAIRISPSGGSFDAGTITVRGKN